MCKNLDPGFESRFVLGALSTLERRVESLFYLVGVDELIARVDQIRRFLKGEPHGRWIRDRKATYNACFPRWEVSAEEALCRFCGLIEIYADCAAEMLVSYPDSFDNPGRITFLKHAEALDVVYWMTNRGATAGLDATIEALERKIMEALRSLMSDREASAAQRIIFSVAPKHLESHELYVSRSYARLRANIADRNIVQILEEEGSARQIVALEWFDLERMKARLESGPAWTEELERAAIKAQAVREEKIAEFRGSRPDIELLIRARDELVFANGRLEAGFGFRGWPGLVLACVRAAASE